MTNILKIEKLNYKNILNNLDFSLEKEKFNILIGSNGSGKTTLVKAILGLIKYSGTINFMDSEMSKKNINELTKNIGVISDFSYLLGHNVFESLLIPLLNLDIKEEVAKKKIYDITKKMHIDNLIFKDVNELSFLEQKMILLTLTIIHQPKLIIIDDSLEGLDEKYKKVFLDYICNMKKSTILFITNDSQYFDLAENIIFMHNGKILNQIENKDINLLEKQFIKNGSKLPFCLELSNKLKSYDLLEEVCFKHSELVNKIWK